MAEGEANQSGESREPELPPGSIYSAPVTSESAEDVSPASGEDASDETQKE